MDDEEREAEIKRAAEELEDEHDQRAERMTAEIMAKLDLGRINAGINKTVNPTSLEAAHHMRYSMKDRYSLGWSDPRSNAILQQKPDYNIVFQNSVNDEQGNPKFTAHTFVNKEPKENKYGVAFSQPHAMDLVDMNGDGLKDLVTGKRFWAHGPKGDPEPNAPAVLYWFELVRHADKSVDWVPHLIDDNSGVGTQVLVVDVNGDKLPDIVVGNKKGTFVHLHQAKKVSKAEWEKAQPQPVSAK